VIVSPHVRYRLRLTLTKNPRPETQRRIQELLEKLKTRELSTEQRQRQWAVMSLELSMTSSARQALDKYAARSADSLEDLNLHSGVLLRQNLVNDAAFAVNLRQALLETLEVKRQAVMLQTEQMQDRGVQISHLHGVLLRPEAKFIG
jgi:hypothetical protein